MKICVSATAKTLDAQVDPKFGRCLYLVIVDSENMRFESFPNVASGAGSGAGIQAAQIIAGKGAEVLITGNVGPNAFKALSATGIKIVTGASGTIREVVEKYKRGELSETGAPTVKGHFGARATTPGTKTALRPPSHRCTKEIYRKLQRTARLWV